MKLTTVNNLDEFFAIINGCKGGVYLVNPDLRLNLKSKLSQLLSLTEVFNNKELLETMMVETDNEEDEQKIKDFLDKDSKRRVEVWTSPLSIIGE